ncbi:MAG: sigma-70 family RNA polymerase sigma factor, partial [Chloroflexota bacterium]|nr:sigma-70 family RNA polymerase sigma factor [Chloroflexota bacterium]
MLRYQAPVRSLLYRLAGNADDAEELAQETFVRVHGHLDGFRRDSSLRTWILRIAANLARDLLRRRRRAP